MIAALVLILVTTGLLFFLGATVGMIRFPNFFARMHAAGKGDTLSTLLILFGLALWNVQEFSMDNLLVSIKILLIIGFIFLTSPTTTHALTRAGYKAMGGQQDSEEGDPSL